MDMTRLVSPIDESTAIIGRPPQKTDADLVEAGLDRRTGAVKNGGVAVVHHLAGYLSKSPQQRDESD